MGLNQISLESRENLVGPPPAGSGVRLPAAAALKLQDAGGVLQINTHQFTPRIHVNASDLGHTDWNVTSRICPVHSNDITQQVTHPLTQNTHSQYEGWEPVRYPGEPGCRVGRPEAAHVQVAPPPTECCSHQHNTTTSPTTRTSSTASSTY